MRRFFLLFLSSVLFLESCVASEEENVVPIVNETPQETPTEEGSESLEKDYPVIYVSIFTHAEQPDGKVTPDFVKDENAFWEQREQVVDFAQMLHDEGVSYNYQSDWTFLEAALKYDKGTDDTLGKNFLQYIHEDLGAEIDPHNHLGASQYNSADVAYLIQQLGVEPSGIVAGFLAAPLQDSEMETFWEPIRGAVYDYTWTPTLLWGSGTFNHRDEESLWVSGIWKPQDAEHFLTHDEGAPLPVIGRYNSSWIGLQELLKKQADGSFEDGKIYTISIDAHQKRLNPTFIAHFKRQIEDFQQYADEGRIVWSTLGEVYEDWVQLYHSEPNLLQYKEP